MHTRVSARLGVLIASSALWLAGAASAGVPSSWAEGALDEGDARVEARLLLHPDPAAAGHVRVGVLFSLDPGWHLYWKNPGESGLPTRLAWRGGAAGPLAWPAPTAFEEGEGLVSYGYEGHVLLASELRLDPDARAVGVDVDLLACRTSCIPARLSLERSLDAVDSGEAADAVRSLFQLHEESLPRSAEALGVKLEASLAGASAPAEIALSVLPCDGAGASEACRALAAPPAGPVFFSEHEGLRVLEVRDHPQRTGGLLVRLEPETGGSGSLRGVLA
ncbi:MAG: protein-disulfide reductase DsbD domain-containing protein, partial [Myxococcota bacterium]